MHDRIDVHAHILPPFLVEAARRAGLGASISAGFPQWTKETAIAFMNENRIASTLYSVSQPGVHFGNDKDAAVLARRCNEFLAELRETDSRRFGGFAAVPLPSIDDSLVEIAYALDALRLDGVGLLASYGAHFLGDPVFDPVLSLLNQRRAIVFIHPNYHPSSKNLGMAIPGFLVEFPFDTTRAVANLIFSGAVDRFPDIKFILAHNGGAIPFLSWRLAMAPLIDKRFAEFTQEGILAAIGRFYFETAQAAGSAPLAAVASVTKPSHVLFGSDWPYCPPAVTQAGDTASLDAAIRGVMPSDAYRSNALALFPRFGAG